MNGFNISGEMRLALRKARQEAAALKQESVTPEHQLLGFLTMDDTVANGLLDRLAIDGTDVAQQLRSKMRSPAAVSWPNGPGRPDLPFTAGAKRALEFAASEALALGGNCVSTGHLLLGILHEDDSLAAELLHALGLSAEKVRVELIALSASPYSARQAQRGRETRMGEKATARAGEQVTSIDVVFRYQSGAVVTKTFSSSQDALKFLRREQGSR